MQKVLLEKDILRILNQKVNEYNNLKFIEHDPISIPHQFSKKQDVEIAAFFAATLAWGNRKSIINSANKIMQAMDNAPHDFIINHEEIDLKRFLTIKHRTFNATDLLYFIHFLKFHYTQHESLETAFLQSTSNDMRAKLISFHDYFFSIEHPHRTLKHVSTPLRNSACKRINMLLRWMVRKDEYGVDFGIWENMKPSELIIPLDVHVSNVAFRLGLIPNIKTNWKNAIELTSKLRAFDAYDPCKFDFALFALGAEERIK